MKVKVEDLEKNLVHHFEDISHIDFALMFGYAIEVPRRLTVKGYDTKAEQKTVLNTENNIKKEESNKPTKWNLRSTEERLAALEYFLPAVEWDFRDGHTIYAKVNGTPRPVKVVRNRRGRDMWTIDNAQAGSILVLLLEDQFDCAGVISSSWISEKKNVTVSKGSARHTALRVNNARFINSLS